MTSAEARALARIGAAQPLPKADDQPMGMPKGRVILYHRDTANRCPSCGKQQWFVGRYSATCAFCEDSIPLASPLRDPDLERNPL